MKNKKVLMIGAGAAIESVLYRVAKSRTKSITLFNRTEEKANRLIRKFSNMANINLCLEEQNDVFDVVINGSSAGLTGEFEPIQGIMTVSYTHLTLPTTYHV